MRSTLATEVPPNFITIRAKRKFPAMPGVLPAGHDFVLARGHATKGPGNQHSTGPAMAEHAITGEIAAFLDRLSALMQARNPAIVELFSDDDATMLIGSEPGEIA